MKKIILLIMLAFVFVSCSEIDYPDKLDTPTNVSYNNQEITFDAVAHADSYVIKLNEVEVTVDATSYTLESYGTFEVSVKAKAEGYLDSSYSDTITVVNDVPLSETIELSFKYSIFSEFDLDVYVDSESFTIDTFRNDQMEDLLASGVYTSENTLYFAASFLQTYDAGSYVFHIETSRYTFEITITMTEDQKPYVYNSSNQDWNGISDIIYYFDFYGATFDAINDSDGNPLISSAYDLNDTVLIIDHAYIASYFEDNAEASSLTLSYVMHDDETTYIGFLIINK